MAEPVHPIVAQLRQARHAQRLTQAAIADRIGYGPWVVQRWEVGAVTPSIDAATAYATAVGLALHVGPTESTAPLLAQSLADLDAHIERRATQLAKARTSELETETRARIAEIAKNADARADKRIRADRDYWRGVALDLKKTLTEQRAARKEATDA